MEFASLWLIVPMIIVGSGALLVLVLGTVKRVSDSGLFYATISTLLLALLELFLRYHAPFELAFGHSFKFDAEASMFKIIILSIVSAILIYARPSLESFKNHIAEFYSLVLLSSMGMMLLASASHLVTIFLGIELMSLPLYALVAIYRDNKQATEAALKYFITGALSSGLLLFGFAWLYGATGSMELSVINSSILGADKTWLVVADVFIISGIAFKFGIAPFHMWVPDVYEAAPTPVTAVIASAPKVAMTALLINLASALGPVASYFVPMMVLLAVISMVLGNVIALTQENFKRMLAYSSVGHMGIIFIAVASNTLPGLNSAAAYVLLYAVTVVLVFSVLMQLKVNYSEIGKISEMAGLAKNYPLQSFAILCAMFSMAGVPPMLGFFAKFMVLSVLINDHSYIWAGVVVLSSVIGAFYYLKVIKAIYFNQADGTALLLGARTSKAVQVLNLLLVLSIPLIFI